MPSTSRSAGTRGRPWRAGVASRSRPHRQTRRCPHLSRLTDPAYLAALLARLDPGQALATARLQVSTIRYRPGQRHVLRVADPDLGRGYVVKTDRDRSGRQAVSAARGLHPMLATVCPETHVVEPLGYSAMEWAALWRLTGGTPLSEQLVGRSPDAAAYVSLVGARGARAARPCPVRPGPGVRGAPARARRGRRDRIHTSGRRPPGCFSRPWPDSTTSWSPRCRSPWPRCRRPRRRSSMAT